MTYAPANKKPRKERCRHERNSWIIFGGFGEWCYVCGAFRHLEKVPGVGEAILKAVSGWRKPSGDKNVNPYHQVKTAVAKEAKHA